MQSRRSIIDLIQSESIIIESTNQQYPFDMAQVGSDSIDLRLGEYFYVLQDDYEYVNTLNISDEFCEEIFKRNNFGIDGYVLKPQEIIFAPTLEIVSMLSSRHYGYVSGRSLYSRLGLSIHCTMTKFGYGMKSIVSLQIINNSPVPMRIYPRQKIAQIEIHEIYGQMDPYGGSYSQERDYILPKTKESEIGIYNEYDQAIIRKNVPKKILKKKKGKYSSDYINKLDRYFKIKTIVEGIFGVGGVVSFFIEAFEKNNWSNFLVLIVALIMVIDFIYSTIALTKGIDTNE